MPTKKPDPNHDLLRIARKEGVSLEAVKNHPDNRDLFGARDAGVLFTEDEVFVPPKEAKKVSAQVGDTVYLVYRPARRTLHLELRDDSGQPRQCDYTLQRFEYDGTEQEKLPGKLYGFAYRGILHEELPAAVARAELVLDDDEEHAITLELGRLDPVSTTRGLKTRLMSLGLYQGDAETSAIDNAANLDEDLREALKRFQRQSGLPATGVADAKTRDKLQIMCGG